MTGTACSYPSSVRGPRGLVSFGPGLGGVTVHLPVSLPLNRSRSRRQPGDLYTLGLPVSIRLALISCSCFCRLLRFSSNQVHTHKTSNKYNKHPLSGLNDQSGHTFCAKCFKSFSLVFRVSCVEIGFSRFFRGGSFKAVHTLRIEQSS